MMPEKIEKTRENRWYSRIFPEILRLDAAGRIRRALIIRMPTHLIESMTIRAVRTAKRFSSKAAGIWRLFANVRFRLTARSLLKANSQNRSVMANIRTRYRISSSVMLKISPTRMLEYLLKLPPFDRMASPSAILQEDRKSVV